MNEDMQKLISLQQIDSEIAGFDHAIAKCEAAFHQREAAIEDEQERLLALQKKKRLLTEKQQETRIEHDEANTRIRESQNRMLMVQTPREHQALLKEVDDARKQVKATEEKALQFVEQLEQLELEASQLAARCASDKDGLDGAKQEAESEIKELQEKRDKVASEREARAEAVPDKLLQRYMKLIEKRRGLAVVAVENGVCMGCHMVLPPQQVIDVMKGETMNFCPTCQRMLYYQEVPEEAEAEEKAPKKKGRARAAEPAEEATLAGE